MDGWMDGGLIQSTHRPHTQILPFFYFFLFLKKKNKKKRSYRRLDTPDLFFKIHSGLAKPTYPSFIQAPHTQHTTQNYFKSTRV